MRGEGWRGERGGSAHGGRQGDGVTSRASYVWGDTEELLALGATLVRRRDDEIDWDVLADPEGNELCVFRPER